jgi:hypothetical protein
MNERGDTSSDETPLSPMMYVLADLTEQITRRLQEGEEVELEACARSDPRCAGPIRRLFPVLRLLASLKRAIEPRDVKRPPSVSPRSSEETPPSI